jgi:SAM-dependent methyltransferase
MHPSSLKNMREVREKYLSFLSGNLTIVDIGGRGLDMSQPWMKGQEDRSYYDIFRDLEPIYYIADIEPGPGVTHVMPGPYTLPFEDNSVDLIVSGQMLEHCKNPFRSVAEMKRVLKPNCYMVLIAPSMGKRHDVIDCWRFMDDAFKAISEEVGLKIVADWVDRKKHNDRSDLLQDHVFVGRK